MTFKRLCFEVQKTMFRGPKGHVLKVKRCFFEKWLAMTGKGMTMTGLLNKKGC